VPVDALLAANPSLSALTGWVPGQSIVLPQIQELPILSKESSLGLQHTKDDLSNWSNDIATQASRLGRSLSGSEVDGEVNSPDERVVLELPSTKMKRIAERQAHEKLVGNVGQTKYTAKQEADYWRQQVTQHFENEASNYASNMLGRLGTARFKASVDKDFKLHSLDMDILAVLQESPDSMTFTQLGLRKNEQKRTIANIGVGRRHFTSDAMIGYNAFLDRDLTRGHMRLGLGGEAWRDYTKLSANAYIPVSKWKDSPDFSDKEERAARGVDLRLQGFLPSHPQLSGSVIAEQYWGDNVDLIGSGRTAHNPRAVTTEVAYSPFPLLNVKVGHTEASGGQSHTSASLGVEWKLGASLSDMLNYSVPDRSMQGLRHDLVERNNNIVLEYREKEILTVSLPESFSELELVALPMVATITHSGKVIDVTWYGDIFGNLNGVSQGNNEGIVIPHLPAFKTGDNTYLIRVVVHDEKGHESQAEGRIVVKEDASLHIQPPIINKYIDDIGPIVGILNTPVTDDPQPGIVTECSGIVNLAT
jgi:adhesin/invasin